MIKNTLFHRFVYISLISFIAIGLILSFYMYKQIYDREVLHALELSQVAIDHTVHEIYEDHHNLDNLSESDLDSIDTIFTSFIFNDNISNIRIWSMEGILQYSDNRSLIGFETLDDAHFDKVIMGEFDYDITKPTQAENIMLQVYGDEFLEIYEPILHEGQPVGILEFYMPFDSIRDRITKDITLIIITTSLGFLFLFVLLSRSIYSNSNKLITTAKSLLDNEIQLNNANNALKTLYKNTILSISKAVDARDKDTGGHSSRVSKIAVVFGTALGLSDDQLEELELTALLHDIGKIGIPEHVLNKPGKLSADEYAIIKEHPVIGYNIIDNIPELFAMSLAVRHHHEFYNGLGYPDGLMEEAIPYFARIIAICDAYDAMTKGRLYRNPLPIKSAKEEILRCRGSQFDPLLVDEFVKLDLRDI